MSRFHKAVLLQEAIDRLQVKSGQKYIDATVGGGGHSIEVIKRGGIVLGIDVDLDAIEFVKNNFRQHLESGKLKIAKGNFKDIDEIAKQKGFSQVSGVLFDLGVSSHQIDDEARGFSYKKDVTLDMRMDKNLKIKASDLLNLLSKGQLYEIFSKFGQEPFSRAISNGIVSARRVNAFETTKNLTDVVERVYGLKGHVDMKKKAQVNNKVFQALRIAVNSEFENLSQALPKAVSLLASKGRLLVISFHSIEDKIVKDTFISMQNEGLGLIIDKKPIVPSYTEILENRRAKSAKLRTFQKI